MLTRFFERYLGLKKKNINPNKTRNGKWKEFNKHAILINEGYYVDGIKNGLWRFYYDTGELIIEEHYNLGQKNGSYTSYFRSGGIMSQGQFVNNLREGAFKVYNEAGEVTKIMIFKNDVLVEETAPMEAKSCRPVHQYDLPMLFMLMTYITYWTSHI